ncbi:hypothetical protein TC41_3006 [Alicyclobacillus acidocaldarius subsp. acidocaldarius Tc-4-1]|uniref:Uncharacterized protein n=1 Tax=Alicyclobacillus acidocaldarius (strain Tc-4-1) TaxID=1048834 RepID=F8ILD8_ALIAT|nr:hypothetical protein TC41_3006 [Alicyclobacillus acidocaldarius subsp. acidocaldarius Tc-4-1]
MAIAIGGLGLMAWSPLVADFVGRPASAARAETSSGHALPLVLKRAPFDWEGRPVYILTNRSAIVLQHLVIRSWEGDLLPLLYIGVQPPSSVPIRPLAHPPYALDPGWSAWFVGQKQPRPRYVINWLDQGVNAYQVVSARLVSPA